MRDALIRFECDAKRGFEAGKVREVKPVGFLAFAGWRDFNAAFDLFGPLSKVVDAASRSNNANAYLFRLFGALMWPVQEEPIFRMCGALPETKLKAWFEKVFDFECLLSAVGGD